MIRFFMALLALATPALGESLAGQNARMFDQIEQVHKPSAAQMQALRPSLPALDMPARATRPLPAIR